MTELKNNKDGEKNKTKADKPRIDNKFLSELNKRLEHLDIDGNKALKLKSKLIVKQIASGFMKPCKISKQLAEFTGWNCKEFIQIFMDYIKENHLNNETDKRNI